ncbi:hypothetical protein [Nonomuraea typhae]|uniref:Uncharacterized protein n=1 Tax=Nonomuraea typhae TaxID=2603600 RepID=A0ABW7YPX1_9ACTN
MMFRAPRGYEALNMHPITKLSTEREILLPRGTSYFVRGVYRKNGQWCMEPDVVPKGWTAVHDRDGRLLGHLWTDNHKAAGFTRIEDPEPDMAYAGPRIRLILANAYKAGIPASDVLDPALYTPDFELRRDA